jgi:NAD(P)-dependent dehydrogenase (short-subunit alcohol dehydrogenase family)
MAPMVSSITHATVITGAGSGIGAATLRRLTANGGRVLAVDLNAGEDSEAIAWVAGDVSLPSTWATVESELAERHWAASSLVASAAQSYIGNVLELSDEAWARTFDVNVMGLVHAARQLLPAMIARRSGSIVVVGSIDSYLAEQGMIAYCASKGAVLQIARALALDHARDGIRVNCVSPGVTDTPLFRKHLASTPDPAGVLKAREQRNPLGRVLDADEVAAMIAFLISDGSSGITGANIVVDAGLTAGYDFRTPDSGS